jgi:hypothetical protein
MKIWRRTARAVFGAHPVDRTIERILLDIEMRARRGLPEVTVSISHAEIGGFRRLPKVTPIVVERIQREGHSVLSADAPNGDWTCIVSLRVRPGSAGTAPG